MRQLRHPDHVVDTGRVVAALGQHARGRRRATSPSCACPACATRARSPACRPSGWVRLPRSSVFASRGRVMLGQVAREAAERFGDHTAYVAPDGRTLSYRELDRRADETAVGLAKQGVGEGDVVALVLPQLPEYFVLYIAAARLGAITAGVNTRLSQSERDVVLRYARRRSWSIDDPDSIDDLRVDGRASAGARPTTPIVRSRSCSPRARRARRRARCSPTDNCRSSPTSTPAATGAAVARRSRPRRSPTSAR